ncbi:TPA: NADP-dependent glyceraldehyde-3-phosphate dehydrogenase [Streptococcus equi subsp. zooepidemicus]|uniref:NADP-dependent glyceraldehyde-3-phosphate dehydrogenase n=1 Tax=Streptococcus equi subsp. zooepidemicus TaxID=40041 RepID=A0A7Z8ZWJ9_STRSZ|nr:NADP-dependent glyceraldehyde-3-phosphate dehydrogenase [Streptococcus equi]MCD3386775.1 NADP-dependent glyceraldehyde-3-phosphate dehydrogenase [Streptococcus equi subsp. zooepidemicus]MCD3405105.1 NADP-dependent glyceraldehyde-3-phosphate dehydrogenase [Streptococcus equi subsp. zooepidemicus]MCD3408386.1 NADP-dependent glyceraldehyde-3-phosphate dehydrogenase [Streptococcus equi subsp. zooepidemicus]MCD3410238.1 NADP-dependent glyceraldehyde-3-phosphate dehydrogenase [Streptococcus equi s
MAKQYKNLVNGEWKLSENEIKIYAPATGEELGSVPAMSREEVDQVYASARAALADWRALSYVERAAYLHKAADILVRDAEKIGAVLSKEVAKGYKAAVSEVIRTAEIINYAAEEGLRMEGEVLEGGSFEAASKKKIAIVRREPVGLVLAISPFNYPINLAGSKIAPALIAGNVVALKPPTQGSISGLLLAEAFAEAGLPAGVFNTITGRGSVIGDYIVEHEAVNFINFTGSTPIGERIGKLAGMRPIMLELGGKDSAIVLEDADIALAAKNIVAGAFGYSGQRCTAVKRVLVMESVADQLVAEIKGLVEKLLIGMPEDNADITPLIDTKAADFVEGLVNDAADKGAQALTEIKRDGNLICPILFDKVTTDMRLAWEEPFGPVLPVIRVSSVEEAISISNQSEYGLQASIFTTNFPQAFAIAEKLEVGTVHINNKTQRGTDNFPFLGAKKSGAGVQGVKYSIEAMTSLKSVVFDIQ